MVKRELRYTNKQPAIIFGRMVFLIFRDLPESNGRYQVSITGLVYDNYANNLLNQYRTREKNPYLKVNFFGAGHLVHRLVADQWVPNPLNLPEIDHIDGNTFNNWASNLRWVTHEQNIQYGWERRAFGITNTTPRLWTSN